jgi:hypothetical protein
VHSDYKKVFQILNSKYEEVSGYDFYKYLFPNNENAGEFNTDFSKPNAIYLYQDKKDQGEKRRLRRRIMLNDTWENDYKSYVEGNPLTLCSGLSYRKRANKITNAQQMRALIIDLDGVGAGELENLFLRFGKPPATIRSLPIPTFLVMSGSGLHVYYVFKEPVDLYPNIKIQMKSLKYDLTFKIWEYKATSKEKQIQYQSINQAFRMVGSMNDKYGTPVKAFRVGEEVTLEYLNQYVKDDNKVDINKPFKPSKMTKAEAKEAYPEWYQRVVVEKKPKLKKWDIKGKQGYALYEWWKKQVGEIRGGHRYYYLMCLAIYACKCDVPKKQLKEDMAVMFDELKGVEHGNPLTEYDIESALEAYDKEYYNFTIADIEKLTDVRIKRNKRNYRKQKEHLLRARTVQQIDYPNGEWRGNTSKEILVKKYIKDNPADNPTQIAKALNMSRTTVYKYMKN